MWVLAVLVVVGIVGVPYLAARALWRIPLTNAARIAVSLAVPVVLIWWLETSPDFHDVTSPGAALLPVTLFAGWSFGILAHARQRLLDRLEGRSLLEDCCARVSSCSLIRK